MLLAARFSAKSKQIFVSAAAAAMINLTIVDPLRGPLRWARVSTINLTGVDP